MHVGLVKNLNKYKCGYLPFFIQPPTYLFVNMEANPDGPRTRSRNAIQHPGLVDKKPQRTTEEVQAEKRRKAAEKQAKQQKKQDAIQRVAQFEDQMAVDDRNANRSHPRGWILRPFSLA